MLSASVLRADLRAMLESPPLETTPAWESSLWEAVDITIEYVLEDISKTEAVNRFIALKNKCSSEVKVKVVA